MNIDKRHNLYVGVEAGEEIVISGIAGRFANTNNLKDLQKSLLNKVDLGSDDHQRWTACLDLPHRIGETNNIEKFDAQFFDISAEEAHTMDPIARIVLEHTYEAIIDAGVNPRELRGTKTGVFIGLSHLDTNADLFYHKPQSAGLPLLGCNKAINATRISYWLGITGPSYNVDTACSSSHFAMEKAYRMIRTGECNAAIVAAGNLCLNPILNSQFYNLGVLSTDGYCKPFDKEGTGYMRSDAVTVTYLQKAKDARRIYATLVYAKTNSDGFKEEGITFPSFTIQKMLLEEFYEECGISPSELSYMEAHGTGTIAGDSVEIMSIDNALCAKRNTCLLVGSVKSNLGHAEPASGLCQIAKVLLAMETGIIMPTIHFKSPREDMPAIIEGRIKIVTEPIEWKGGYVGINSFGFGGANCHVLLKSNPKTKINNGIPDDDLPRLVAVSGRTEEAVKIILDDVQTRSLDAEYISLLHYIHNDNIEGHYYRGYTIIGSKIQANNTISKIEIYPYIKRPVCFIFSGLGCQQFGMSRALMKFSVFAKAVQKCDIVLRPYNIFIIDILMNKSNNTFNNIVHLFVGLVGLQIGMVDLLISIGIVPNFIIGHSIGELICGYADGCLTLEETILSAYFIGLALVESKIIDGLMAEINLGFDNIKNICPSDVDIACYNSSHNSIVSGPTSSIKALLAKLQVNNISVREISCRHIPFHSRYVEAAKKKILKYLSRILPQEISRSRKWLIMSKEWLNASPMSCLAQYYTNCLLSPVLFAEAICSIPNYAVTIELSPQSILQCILKDSLHFTVTNIALYECSENYDIETFLRAVGQLYNAKLQPQIVNLYPKIEFPVSRGTQMISPLVRWNHSMDYYVMHYVRQIAIDNRELVFNIDISDEEFMYMTGHIINRRNLLPAAGYLFLIWQMVASLRRQEHNNISIIFEDVNFIRATVLSQQNKTELILMIQKGSNRFEIIEGDNAIVTGRVRVPENIENEKLSTDYPGQFIDDEEEMDPKDIYKELRLRGYQYADLFRGLKSASITGKNGHINWSRNWVAFMDNVLQIMILGQNSRSLFVPTRIRKLIIDPKYHMQLIKNLPIEKRRFPVRNYTCLDTLISGGVQIYGAEATAIPRRQRAINTILEEYKFVAHCDLDTILLQHAIIICIHIALECYNMINVKLIEFVENGDRIIPENLNSPFINKILGDLPLIRHNIRLVTTCAKFRNISLPNNVSTTEFSKLPKDEKYLMVIGFEILTKNRKELYEQLLSVVIPQGFLLTLEELDAVYDYSCLNKYGLDIILEKRTNQRVIILLRKKQDSANNQMIVYINNYEFSWVDELKSLMTNYVQKEQRTDTRIILVAEGDFECGLLGLINCLQKEPGGEIIRGIFIQDKTAPAFSLQEPLYIKQIRLDLPINVLRPGNVWGSYRHFPLQSLKPVLIYSAEVTQKVRGDVSTLCWVQKRISFIDKDEENLISIVYASINFRDIMIATGRLVAEIISSIKQDNYTSIGMEFVGFNTSGQRIMGLCSSGGMTNIQVADKYLSWIIPDKWTLEDAATVPCVYSTCYYALYIKGKMKKGDRILIHSGTGGVGQAAIYLALYEGCEVFTTVGSVEKRQFIRETFPSIPEDHIGNSRDTSFEQMIIQRTKGRGVNIVLNSLAEEKLLASIRCLAPGGRFLEIGKFDMLSNNPLDTSVFSKGISFHGILLDKLFVSSSEQKIILQKRILEGLENGAIKPLCRKIFGKNEIEAAFRYMAAGKHIGKIIIKVREEGESLYAPLFAYPRYYCLEHKCYIILGGLGGFGLELANWLVERGAKNLLLTSRTGIRNGYQRSRVTLWQSYGVNVQIFKVNDTLKHDNCESILRFAEKQGPVDAIFNLAVVLKDSIFQNQSPETFENSFMSKAWMTKKMDELSRIICSQLRHFVVFSSVSCGRGNSGQTNYGMANSVMERICEKRKKEGLHGLAIQWGAIGDVGIVADMQEDNKELVIGGTLQQDILSCLDTLEIFLLQDRPIVSSMIVAEKSADINVSMNICKTVADIMGLKNTNLIAQNMSLAEMGMDSMMAVEIKQTLEREFDVFLTAQDIRNMNFAKLREIADIKKSEKTCDASKTDENNLGGFKILTRIIKNSDLVPDILIELDTKREVTKGEIFLLPGIEGCSSVFKSITSKIKPLATCLQHGVLNIPDQTRSVIKSAAYFLPHILEKMKDQERFLIVGYSFGSLIAIELARLLEAKNISGQLILIDGTPDQMKSLIKQLFYCSSQQDLQNVVLLRLMEMYHASNNEMLSLELDKCSTWDEKLEVLAIHIPKNFDILTVENLKLLCSTVYDHIIAIQDYNTSALPRLKSPVTLLKATFTAVTSTEEDYGLHKITEGKVQVYCVEGTHVTIMDSDKVISAINGEDWTEV